MMKRTRQKSFPNYPKLYFFSPRKAIVTSCLQNLKRILVQFDEDCDGFYIVRIQLDEENSEESAAYQVSALPFFIHFKTLF